VSRRDAPPFRADHVGSLLRPQELLRARQDLAEGHLSAEELRRLEDTAIRDVVRLQEGIGLRSATDGEFRRASWHMDFIYQLAGVTRLLDQSLTVEFENALEGNTLTRDDQIAKLRLVVETAEEVWGR
jgi:5-methyltetrahydropteroyltriglutamate--homocysteine methyltransferase